jgi:hypothetical protein
MQIQKLPRRERLLYYRFYFKMIEADRDASVLRFFEALLESLPQLLIQGYFLLDNLVKSLDNNAIEFDWKCEFGIFCLNYSGFSVRAFAMIASLLSISFSFVSHHRSLRICLPDKQNLNVTGCNLIVSIFCQIKTLFLADLAIPFYIRTIRLSFAPNLFSFQSRSDFTRTSSTFIYYAYFDKSTN